MYGMTLTTAAVALVLHSPPRLENQIVNELVIAWSPPSRCSLTVIYLSVGIPKGLQKRNPSSLTF